MITFIPPFMGKEIKSNAERKMFGILQKLELKNGFILHSLGLPKHRTKIYGEIDFVVVCSRGVACLEIKGGRVECRAGCWTFTDRHGVARKKAEGPFAQVTGNMFSLRDILRKQFQSNPQMKNLLLACGVVFPDIKFQSSAQEIIDEIVYDKKTGNITDYINQVFDYWQARQHKPSCQLSAAAVEQIVRYLRGEFTFIPALADRLDTIENRLIRLTEEQCRLMESLAGNDRLLVEGCAGTGKTLLAIDFAVKKACEGNRVLYLTYNKNLSGDITRKVEENDHLKIINIHALFGEYIPVNQEKLAKNPGTYFSEILPKEFYEYICALGSETLSEMQYDVLVMDEGQDIIKPDYLYSLDYLLKGSLAKGRWAVFYDENQNIYNPDYQDGLDILLSYNAAKFKLFVNCRNTVQIGTYSSKVSGIPLEAFIKENGEEVRTISYTDDKDYAKKLKDVLKSLQKEEVSMHDIVFLAPKKYANSKLAKAGIQVEEIKKEAGENEQLPRFATIQGYKGLDSKIIILCDVEDIFDKNYSRFMYIAATRARTLLYIVGSQEFWTAHKIT